MSSDCAAPRIALGAYVLGALEPADRAAVANHLGGCAECRAELAGLAGLPGLLARLQLADVVEPDEPSSTDLDIAAIVDAVHLDTAHLNARTHTDPRTDGAASAPNGSDHPRTAAGTGQDQGPDQGVRPGQGGWQGHGQGPRHGQRPDQAARPVVEPRAGTDTELTRRALASLQRARRRARRRAVLASAGLLVAVVLATVGITVSVHSNGDSLTARPPGRMYTGASTTSQVEAWVWVAANPAGSAFTVKVANVRPGSHCTLIAQAVDGHEETAAMWAANYDGDVEVRGTAGIEPANLARLLIVDAQGGRIVVLPARGA